MIIRDPHIAGWIGGAFTAWGCWFTVDLSWPADNVTSKQWQYLMSIPRDQPS